MGNNHKVLESHIDEVEKRAVQDHARVTQPPQLLRAFELYQRQLATKLGPKGGHLPHIVNEVTELVDAWVTGDPAAIAEEMGDVMANVVFTAFSMNVDPLAALDAAVNKVGSRLNYIEDHLHIDRDAPGFEAEIDRLWREAKVLESQYGFYVRQPNSPS